MLHFMYAHTLADLEPEGKQYFTIKRMSAASISRIHDEKDDFDKEM